MNDESERKQFSYKDSRERKRKFVRYKDGAEIYSMGLSKFQEIAKESGAVYKVNSMCLVNTEILDNYLEAFRVEPNKK
ncbi:MAG: DUF6462 family protein [Lachnospiraceae bacterium]|nr:DUF6462 family protein [Lachnospiraceae bacterium]